MQLDAYISKLWYVQQQMTISYLPVEYTHCVTAQYGRKGPNLFGYDISVTNLAYTAAGKLLGPLNSLCGKVVDEANGRLEVSPCFLPKALAGPYWVLAFSEIEGYALVSGGPPKHASGDGCKTGTGTNDSGLWIFTHERNPSNELVEHVRSIAEALGFDLSVLVNIDQSNCTKL